MCFSAQASFIAAAVVGAAGCLTLKEATSRRQLCLAILPMLFAIQQACEGIIWIFLEGQMVQNWLFVLCKVLYVLFGYILWPVMFSLSALLLEDVPWRKKVLTTSLALGAFVSAYFAWHFATQGIHVSILGNSISYDITHRFEGLSYLAALSIPYIFSSVRYLPLMGIIAPVSFTASAYFYWVNFASVWCFFAAFISMWIWFVIAHNRVAPPTRTA